MTMQYAAPFPHCSTFEYLKQHERIARGGSKQKLSEMVQNKSSEMVQNKTHWSPVRSFSHFKQSLRPTKYAPSYKPMALMEGDVDASAVKCSALNGGVCK
jgi:hypothetical protein